MLVLMRDIYMLICTINYLSVLLCVCVCVRVCVHAQLHLSLCNPMECSLPVSSIHGIFQARILEWDAISFWPLDKEEAVSHTWLKSKPSKPLSKMTAISTPQRKAWIVIASDLALPVKSLSTHQLYITLPTERCNSKTARVNCGT